MANIFQKIAFATVAISIAAIDINPAKAATITYNFEVTPDSGELAGETYSGSFSYDNKDIKGDGEEFISASALSFTFEEVKYTEANGLSEAEVAFLNGELLGLSFSAGPFSFIPGFFELSEAYLAYDAEGGSGAGDVTYTPEKVPEPSALLGLGLLGGGLLLKKAIGKSKSR